MLFSMHFDCILMDFEEARSRAWFHAARMLMPFFLLAAVNALVDGASVIQAA